MQIKKVSKQFFIPKNNYEQFAMQIYFLLVENFSKTFFVGGIVRDLLLHKKINDIDITTAATPEEVISILKKHNIVPNSQHKNFGVIKVTFEDKEVEITTMRKELYTGTRYPQVTFISSLAIDSKRRDFTVNSLYLQAKEYIIYDPQLGLKDLTKKQIKIIGNEKRKLHEDPVRIIRAYKFSKQLQFTFETKTEAALQKYFYLVHTISKTKLQNEIEKIKNNATKKFVLQLLKNS